MSQKAVDQKNRWRSKTVAFRVSPEEWEKIERLVKLSGMSKQGYIMHRLQNTEMTIQASPRVVKALKLELKCIAAQLDNLEFKEAFGGVEKIEYLVKSIKTW
ncbi:plasmid mobilization protein [Chakrabartyella piscis]|uniref:plasmid mobilization protein n=1 Tax=Chakrabartyella piscis TaxID=2918914 RepID=UPI0029589525|nr:hypothetical protein [Chakrabartyella piscis]